MMSFNGGGHCAQLSAFWTPVCHCGFERRVDADVRVNRQFIIHELHEAFSHVARCVLFQTITVQLR
jgi:hypothetical protein